MHPETAPGDDRDAAAARMTQEVIELLEVMWHKGRDLTPTAPASPSQLRVLYILDRDGGINLRTLGRELGAAPSSVSRLCDRLQALGFIERSTSPASRRELELRLTVQGEKYLREVRDRRERALLEVMARVPVGDRAALVQGLSGFLEAAQDSTGQGSRSRAAPGAADTA